MINILVNLLSIHILTSCELLNPDKLDYARICTVKKKEKNK